MDDKRYVDIRYVIDAWDQLGDDAVKKALEEKWLHRSDTFWGITFYNRGGNDFGCTFADGSPLRCTGYALEIKRRTPDTEVWGFYGKDNPRAAAWNGVRALGDGHDFAVIKDRWIVDPWLHDVEGVGPGVYDLCDPDPANIAAVEKFYGERACWQKVS